ncbi:bactofilin family protein [Vreelandella populi]|uniref:Polymer-forming cytoskeletal protein n=1 Tax=Vreelandella populi TaxID=2498858 RepID=A0A433LGB4_9GAMM|nr:polymer-forming cytoskeletal protein [Halomonas populi]RUR37917.1 polymer-forming cytoskeletal protein [Halomonas populi]RUR48895.1 polymer-forming cytoskeletal protein [Halomonas populi]RUR55239.1 polymer-forming cytoskeletal protein [Halomonas populi]
MGIEAWLIVIGVSAMTLIVWDGRCRKAKQRPADQPTFCTTQGGLQMPHAAVSFAPDEVVENTRPEAGITPVIAPLTEGSRVGAATHISGNIKANEPVLIKGSVQGRVVVYHHSITVTSTGHVGSYMKGNCIAVDGHVVGALKAITKLTLLSQARVQGVIETPCLECVAGALLQANVSHSTSQQDVCTVS